MRVHLLPPITPSIALHRVDEAFLRYSPKWVTFTDEASAELVIIPVVGRRDHIARAIQRIEARGQRYAMIQYCLRSTKTPQTQDWSPLWVRAAVVWSYIDLRRACEQDSSLLQGQFYHAPLGLARVFQPDMFPLHREYTIF